MLQLKRCEYVGVLYDYIEEVVIEQSPIIRATWDEAMADARALVQVVNDAAESSDDADEADGHNWTVGRVDESYCYVQDCHGYENEDDKADREFDEHADREELRAMGRLPSQDDTPSLPPPAAY